MQLFIHIVHHKLRIKLRALLYIFIIEIGYRYRYHNDDVTFVRYIYINDYITFKYTTYTHIK